MNYENERGFRAGDLVRHFKGGLYKILGDCINTETDDIMILYKDERNDHKIFCRSMESFCAKVDKVKYPDATQEYRMEYIGITCSCHPLDIL